MSYMAASTQNLIGMKSLARQPGFSGMGQSADPNLETLQELGATPSLIASYQSGQIDFPTAMNMAAHNYSPPVQMQTVINPPSSLISTGSAIESGGESLANATVLPGGAFAQGVQFTSGVDLTNPAVQQQIEEQEAAQGVPSASVPTDVTSWLESNWMWVALAVGVIAIGPTLVKKL